jgi:hypothetical protein
MITTIVKTRVSYAEYKFFTYRMYPLLKFYYEIQAARHFRHLSEGMNT